ncbi:MAG: (2E,6E)-farnesyl diphosphate synthase [Methylophaga sp.]|nr:(2E,6E)-farnesyl diphosphate synthase [Methylophaga sp.]
MTIAFSLNDWMSAHQQRVGNALTSRLQISSDAQTLVKAMQYATLDGGKRLRALLVYAAGETLYSHPDGLDAAACAVEMIHAYSLIHDDMPMMDDDDLRRGRPSCHKAFDEATALLAGDALQTHAFLSLSDNALPAEQRIAMVKTLAKASGVNGMAGGQAIDLQSVGKTLNLSALENMHQLKTGALIRASVQLGALASAQTTERDLQALDQYAKAIGLAFQVQDDVLDVVADTLTLGKQQGADVARDKPTYPALLGLEAAQQKARDLVDQALSALQQLTGPTQALSGLAGFVVQRTF